MKKILLIVPEGTGTIALVSKNLETALKLDPNNKVFLINLSSTDQNIFHGKLVFNLKKRKSFTIFCKIFILFERTLFLKKIKHRIKPDISIACDSSSALINLMTIGKDKKMAIFHSPLKQIKTSGKIPYFVNLMAYKYLFIKYDRLICVSSEVKNDLIHYIPKAISKITIFYNIHDIDAILNRSKIKLDSLYDTIFSKDVILYLGNLYYIKAPDRLIRAYSLLKKLGNLDANLVFIGEDLWGTKVRLQKIISHYGLENEIFFIPPQTNPYNFIKNSKILVSSSKSEGLPGVLIESLILKIPVISTNSSSGVWEILSAYENYQPDLDKLHIMDNGIITPNINKSDTLDCIDIQLDDIYLAKAINKLLDNNFYKKLSQSNFPFVEKVRSNSIEKFPW